MSELELTYFVYGMFVTIVGAASGYFIVSVVLIAHERLKYRRRDGWVSAKVGRR
ncbi:MAG: hypothetical protein V3U34_00525 [candidate division NC10 bacterium]